MGTGGEKVFSKPLSLCHCVPWHGGTLADKMTKLVQLADAWERANGEIKTLHPELKS